MGLEQLKEVQALQAQRTGHEVRQQGLFDEAVGHEIRRNRLQAEALAADAQGSATLDEAVAVTGDIAAVDAQIAAYEQPLTDVVTVIDRFGRARLAQEFEAVTTRPAEEAAAGLRQIFDSSREKRQRAFAALDEGLPVAANEALADDVQPEPEIQPDFFKGVNMERMLHEYPDVIADVIATVRQVYGQAQERGWSEAVSLFDAQLLFPTGERPNWDTKFLSDAIRANVIRGDDGLSDKLRRTQNQPVNLSTVVALRMYEKGPTHMRVGKLKGDLNSDMNMMVSQVVTWYKQTQTDEQPQS